MLLDLLLQYLRDVEAAIQRLAGAYVERYEEEIVASNRANFRIRVRFPNDNTPHFPDFENFPHHKHFPDKVTGVEQPSILDVIEEARLFAQ